MQAINGWYAGKRRVFGGGLWRKRRARKEIKKREIDDFGKMEAAIRNGIVRLQEELNLRLICEFCGAACMGEDEREALMRFAKATGNVSLWREFNLPGNILQVQSIDIVGIVWPAAVPVEKKEPGRLKNVLSALFRLLRGKKRNAG